jgi:hypothetical protein
MSTAFGTWKNIIGHEGIKQTHFNFFFLIKANIFLASSPNILTSLVKVTKLQYNNFSCKSEQKLFTIKAVSLALETQKYRGKTHSSATTILKVAGDI